MVYYSNRRFGGNRGGYGGYSNNRFRFRRYGGAKYSGRRYSGSYYPRKFGGSSGRVYRKKGGGMYKRRYGNKKGYGSMEKVVRKVLAEQVMPKSTSVKLGSQQHFIYCSKNVEVDAGSAQCYLKFPVTNALPKTEVKGVYELRGVKLTFSLSAAVNTEVFGFMYALNGLNGPDVPTDVGGGLFRPGFVPPKLDGDEEVKPEVEGEGMDPEQSSFGPPISSPGQLMTMSQTGMFTNSGPFKVGALGDNKFIKYEGDGSFFESHFQSGKEGPIGQVEWAKETRSGKHKRGVFRQKVVPQVPEGYLMKGAGGNIDGETCGRRYYWDFKEKPIKIESDSGRTVLDKQSLALLMGIRGTLGTGGPLYAGKVSDLEIEVYFKKVA